VHLLVCYTSISKDPVKNYVKTLKLNFVAFAIRLKVKINYVCLLNAPLCYVGIMEA